jgi:hypothetical protein
MFRKILDLIMDIKLEFIIITLIVVFIAAPMFILFAHSVSKSTEGDKSFLSKFNRFVGIETRGGYKK